MSLLTGFYFARGITSIPQNVAPTQALLALQSGLLLTGQNNLNGFESKDLKEKSQTIREIVKG
jgi:hypothetical protein